MNFDFLHNLEKLQLKEAVLWVFLDDLFDFAGGLADIAKDIAALPGEIAKAGTEMVKRSIRPCAKSTPIKRHTAALVSRLPRRQDKQEV